MTFPGGCTHLWPRHGGDELNGAPAGPQRGRAAKLRPSQGAELYTIYHIYNIQYILYTLLYLNSQGAAERTKKNDHHLPRQARDKHQVES